MNDEQSARCYAAGHAVQAGTKMLSGEGGINETSAIDCRIGLNVQMAEFGGLCQLLIEKGVLTSDEVAEAMIAGLIREKERMEDKLSALYGGAKITLV